MCAIDSTTKIDGTSDHPQGLFVWQEQSRRNSDCYMYRFRGGGAGDEQFGFSSPALRDLGHSNLDCGSVIYITVSDNLLYFDLGFNLSID